MAESENSTQSSYKRLKPKEFLKISAWILKFVYRINPKFASLYTGATILKRLSDIVNTVIMAQLVDSLVKAVQSKAFPLETVYYYLALIFGFNLIQTILELTTTWSWNSLSVTGRPGLRREFYKKINSLGIQTLEQPEINNHIHRADMYLGDIFNYLDRTIEMIASLVRFVALTIIISSFFPLFIPVVIGSAIPYFIFDKKQRSNLYKFINENTENQRKAGNTAGDLASSTYLQEIHLTQAFDFLDRKFWGFHDWYTKAWIKILTKWRVGISSLSVLSDLVIIICTAKVFTDAFQQLISVGTLLFRYRILNQFQDSIQSIFRGSNDLSEQAIRIFDVYYIFNATPAFPEGNTPLEKLEQGPAIELRNISFKYPNAESLVVENLSLKIKSGEKIAIVGPNGAGKTTIVKLICKLYRVTKGKILINNGDLADIYVVDWHKNLGVLFQDYNTYSQLTVKENIVIGNSDKPVNEDELVAASKHADAYDFIDKFPFKFDQVLGEKYKNGIRPSTGQWQKLAIARFFYRNAPLVIFDEPTASIDAVSEYNIFNKIYEFFENKTVIIISHRFSTVRNADRIIVLKDGQITEEGSHSELMKKNGQYAQAFLLQAEGYATEKIDTLSM